MNTAALTEENKLPEAVVKFIKNDPRSFSEQDLQERYTRGQQWVQGIAEDDRMRCCNYYEWRQEQMRDTNLWYWEDPENLIEFRHPELGPCLIPAYMASYWDVLKLKKILMFPQQGERANE